MVTLARTLRPWFWVVALLLVLDLLMLGGQIKATIDAGACLERAQSELISCVGPPPELPMLVAVVLAFFLAALLVLEVARARAVAGGGSPDG